MQVEEEAVDVCSTFNRVTGWRCKHKGQTLIDNTGIQLLQTEPEVVKIRRGGGANYAVQVRHKFSNEEVTRPASKKPIDTILVVRADNGGDITMNKKFRYADNTGIPTHRLNENAVTMSAYENGIIEADLNGWINPAYNGEYFVDIICDDNCNCSAKKRVDACKVVARLEPSTGTWEDHDDK